MSDKLKASVTRLADGHCACLSSAAEHFNVGPVCKSGALHDDNDARERAQIYANMLTKAIEQHDKAVHAELLAQRDRLAKVCKAFIDLTFTTYDPLSLNDPVSVKAGDLGPVIIEMQAAIAEVENSDG